MFAATSAFSFLYGLKQQIGGNFILMMMLSLLLFAPLPLILYRMYALARASYRLERDGLRLRWGLRAEDIPLPEVEWVRRASDLPAELPLPRLYWPGALLGAVQVRDLGAVEYMASTTENLLLIATAQRIYAISPENAEEFLRAFQRTFELGSLSPISSASVLPAAYLAQIWSDRLARVILIVGLGLILFLWVGVSLSIPSRQTVSLGYSPGGQPLPGVPAEQMILLPVLAAFVFVIDLAVGLFFYRRDPRLLLILSGAAGRSLPCCFCSRQRS